MSDKLTRRDFFRKAGIVGVATVGLGFGGGELLGLMDDEAEAASSILSIARGGSPEAMVKKAVDGLGGIKKFVRSGDTVVIKPNIAWGRNPEQAANTNPGVLAGIIKLCKQAGAKRITVIDYTCDSAAVTFNISGAKKVCSAAGVRLVSADNERMYRKIDIPKGKAIKSDTCLRDILEADVFINVPIAKVHGASVITASMKNLMGVSWNRGSWHRKDLQQCIADYATAVKPDLIILDAVRVLLTNGPKGPGETKDVGQIAASKDPVAIDTYAATLLGIKPKDVAHIVHASAYGLGQMDLKKVAMKKA